MPTQARETLLFGRMPALSATYAENELVGSGTGVGSGRAIGVVTGGGAGSGGVLKLRRGRGGSLRYVPGPR